MTFVQFYDRDIAGDLMPIIGDRGIVVLDGRLSISNLIAEGKAMNGVKRPKYAAMAICKGDSFGRFQFITPILTI